MTILTHSSVKAIALSKNANQSVCCHRFFAQSYPQSEKCLTYSSCTFLENARTVSFLQHMCGFTWLLLLFRSKELQSESVDLRERIKHLNDMVFCQQRKVKGMIEEVKKYLFLSVDKLSAHTYSNLLFSTQVLILGR